MSASPIKIGLVEDNPLDVDLVQMMLAEPPEILFELHQSSRLSETLALLENKPLDVMLLDLGLPDCQGLEAFHRVKSRAPNLPIIIFSGDGEKELAIRAVAEGAQDYLVKGQTSSHMLKRAIFYAIERQRVTHEQLVRATFSAAATGIATTKSDGEFILVNPAYCKMVGYSETELRALNFYTLIHPDDQTRNLELTGQLLAGKIDDFSVEERYVKKDGGFVWIRASVSLERSPDGQPLNIITVSEDIAERKRAEDALHEREEQLRLYAEHSPAAIAMVDRDMKYIVVSRRWMEDYRLGDQSIIGRSHYEVFPDIPQRWIEIHQRCLAGAVEKCDEDPFLRADGRTDWIRWEVRPWHRADGSIGGIILFSEDISERKNAEAVLEKQQIFLGTLLENISDGIVACDERGMLSLFNRATREFHGLPEESLPPDQWAEHYDLFLADGQTPMRTEQIPLFRAFQGEIVKNVEMVIAPKNLPRRVVVCNGQAILTASGQRSGAVVVLHDITERKQSELELVRLNRALRMLTSCNEMLIHATDEKQLLSSICQLAVEIGGYRMAWVGYAQDDASRSIIPVGYAGSGVDYLTQIKISWSEDNPGGQGPEGKTIRSGAPVVMEDVMQDDPEFSIRAKAQKYGYRSLICLPLRDKKRTFGLLALYSGEARPMTDDEMLLLQELADNLVFGVANIRALDEQRRIQSAVSKIAASVSASTGVEFFEELAYSMTEALEGQAGFVARLQLGEPRAARVIAAVVDGKVIDNFDYVIEGASCEYLLQGEDCIVPVSVAEHSHLAPLLATLGARTYVSKRLDNSLGQPVGLLFVVFSKPLKQSDFIIPTLQIFAARAAAELGRQEADKRIRDQASLLDKAQDAIVVRGLDHIVHFWNKGAERLYGWTSSEVLGTFVEKLLYDDPANFFEAVREVIKLGEWSGEITQRRKDGSTVTVEAHWNLVRDDNDQPHSILAINTDISQRKAAEEKIEHLAFYDNLTGLANRLLLVDRLQQALAVSARNRRMGALLFIDLDYFKKLNDSLGHDMGDLLLQQVAHRLIGCVRESDTVARLGGDEFVVMLEDMSGIPQEAATQAKIVSEKILASFNQPFQLAGYEHHSTPSIGVTLFSDQLNTVEELLKRADIAMYQAKASGRNAMRFFDPEMQAVISARTVLEADLHEALQQSEFLLHYQPQIDSEGRIIGAEALVRWQHPKLGLVLPVKFIPTAEDTGLILLLGHWVLETACAQLAVWATRPETAALSLSVNVSARQFRQPDFVEQVLAVVDYTGANPQRLKLELTESLLVDNVEDVITKMTALKAKGVGFSLDDFGTGYSSLTHLKRLPLDQLKIDQSFVMDVLTDPHDAAIAHTIVALGQSLGMMVIAEGVETEEQRDFLAQHGCNAYQGYLFSQPLPIEQFEEFVQARKKTIKKTRKKIKK